MRVRWVRSSIIIIAIGFFYSTAYAADREVTLNIQHPVQRITVAQNTAPNTKSPIKKQTKKSVKTKSKKKTDPLPKGQPKIKPNQGGGVSWQIHTGNDYLQFPTYDRVNYVAGLSDAYNWSFDGGFQRMKWIVECSRGRPMEQLAGMFDKWLKNHPERWHEPAAKLYAFALFELCQPQSKSISRPKK